MVKVNILPSGDASHFVASKGEGCNVSGSTLTRLSKTSAWMRAEAVSFARIGLKVWMARIAPSVRWPPFLIPVVSICEANLPFPAAAVPLAAGDPAAADPAGAVVAAGAAAELAAV